VAHFVDGATLRYGDIARQCRSAEHAQIDFRSAMIADTDGLGDARCGLKLPDVALTVGEGKRVELIALRAGDRQHRGGIETARE
jgi:hypothetical protein